MRYRKPPFRARLDQGKVWARLNELSLGQNELAQRIGTSSGYSVRPDERQALPVAGHPPEANGRAERRPVRGTVQLGGDR